MSAIAGSRLRTYVVGLALAGTVLGGAGLAACGGGSTAASGATGSAGGGSPPSGSPAQVLTAMTGASLKAGTARVNMTVTAKFSGIPGQSAGSYTIAATGAFDLGKKQASLVLNLGQLDHNKTLHLFTDGKTAYLNAADLGISSAKPWISYDSTTSSSGGGFDFTQMTASAFSGPQLLSKLSNPTAVGTEVVGGVKTTHYKGTLDLSTALDSLSSSGNSGAGVSALLGPALQGATVPVDAWIDGQDRLRRFSFSMDLSAVIRALAGAFGNSGDTTTTLPPNFTAQIGLDMTLSDFGANLNLAPPPANQVGPAPANFKLPGS